MRDTGQKIILNCIPHKVLTVLVKYNVISFPLLSFSLCNRLPRAVFLILPYRLTDRCVPI